MEFEPLDLSYVLTPEFWFQQFTNLDGVHTGVPTATTPTLTPTTLRTFQQTLRNLECETAKRPEHLNEAGFVPPPIHTLSDTQGGGFLNNNNNSSTSKTFVNVVDSKAWLGGSTTITSTPVTMNRHMMLGGNVSPALPSPPAPTRRSGGRRPNKSLGLSPEEEERRSVRRERNKLAAARCRKRRLDHTNELIMEVEELEQKKMNLQKQIQAFQSEKEHLEFILEAHSANCRLNGQGSSEEQTDLKPLAFEESMGPRVMVQQQPQLQPRLDAATVTSQSQPQPSSQRRPQLGVTAGAGGTKPSRPSSLPVVSKPHEYAGVPITTPSSLIPLNFDSLMEGGTGFTPVGSSPYCKDGGFNFSVPSCSTQQRSNEPETISPDSMYSNKLVSL